MSKEVFYISLKDRLIDALQPELKSFVHEYGPYFEEENLLFHPLSVVKDMIKDAMIKAALEYYGSDYPIEVIHDRVISAPKRSAAKVRMAKKLGSIHGGWYWKNARFNKNM